ncbi:MAG: HAMP domain-containing histidine kinase [Kineosporiaceae bacterium]|nr:HAMP domain-containing histidine kinase [Aeromicrobium sp.]
MTVVLLATSGFVFWRVQSSLDRQVHRDLRSYHDVVTQAITTETEVPTQTPGQYYQIFDAQGQITFGSTKPPAPRILSDKALQKARGGATVYTEYGRFFPAGGRAFRVEATNVATSHGKVVLATAISRQPRDEALRELLGQLAIANLLVLIAASYVGYRTVRAALDPVENYRRAAKAAGETAGTRLPVTTDRDDELTRLGHTFNDLLARIEAETEREHRYIADAAHELRTPLALLKGEVELALHKPRSAEYSREALKSVAAEVDRMADLANTLLDLEELESGIAGSETQADVSTLLTKTADRFRASLERDSRTIIVDAAPGAATLSEPWIDAALSNLVSNAVRYGEGTVTVSAIWRPDVLTIAVSDEGDGFPNDIQDRAFDRFTRADLTRTTRGSGLGLALVKAIAEAHGGTAKIEHQGRPTRVVIEVPIGAETTNSCNEIGSEA